MSRAVHPLLERLHRGAGAPAQLLASAQAVQSLFGAIGSGLQRVGLDLPGPWERLLQAPLAAPGWGLQAALAGLAQPAAPAEAAAAGLRPPRAPAPASTAPPAGSRLARALAGESPDDASRATLAGGLQRAGARTKTSSVALSAGAAAATWRQRAADAGLQDAFDTPLRERPLVAHALAAAGKQPTPRQAAAAAAEQRGGAGTLIGGWRTAALDTASSALALAQRAAPSGTGTTLLPRLQAVLERIDAPTDAESRTRGPGAAPEARQPRGAAALGMAALAMGDAAASAATLAALAPAAPPEGSRIAAALAPAAPARGLRGLAARAAASAPAAAPRLADEAPTSTAQTIDDEQLAEQLARVLKREAERDGIDTSDVAP